MASGSGEPPPLAFAFSNPGQLAKARAASSFQLAAYSFSNLASCCRPVQLSFVQVTKLA